jgi:hypothetical protein
LNMSIQAFDPPLLSLRCWSYWGTTIDIQ